MKTLIGKEYREIESQIKWDLLFEDIILAILNPRIKTGKDFNLVGVSTVDLKVKWELGGTLDDQDRWDGVVNLWVRDGQVHVGIWSGTEYTIDHRTGQIQETIFTK